MRSISSLCVCVSLSPLLSYHPHTYFLCVTFSFVHVLNFWVGLESHVRNVLFGTGLGYANKILHSCAGRSHRYYNVVTADERCAILRNWVSDMEFCCCLIPCADAVSTVLTQAPTPQVTTASYDSTVRLWDMGMGKCITTLTNHKKAVRAATQHPTEYAILSAFFFLLCSAWAFVICVIIVLFVYSK